MSFLSDIDWPNLAIPESIQHLLQHMPQHVKAACTLVTLKKGSVLVKASEASSYVYLIISGRLVALAEYPTGINYSFAEMTSFDIVGEMEALIGDSCYAVSVKAETNCKAIRMTKETFLDWIRQNAEFSFAICQLVTKKLFNQVKAHRNSLFLSATDRLVLHLIDCYKRQHEEATLHLQSTRQQISDEIGFCTKTVNRCLKKLHQGGYLLLNRSHISISPLQYKKLAALMTKQIHNQ